MCGIAGAFDPNADSRAVIQRDMIIAMRDALVHRGPDDAGIHLEPHIGLGHRRLSIIDVAGGLQPIFNEDETVAVIFNGEIYNYQALTRELKELGHRFATDSDTEVIVHAWEQWGEECVNRLQGMFAFALWDRNRKTLFLARDRLGVKPMFYASLRNGQFAFASELKSIKLLPGFDRALEACAVEDYLAFGYVPDPRTIYRNAFKLPPGHTLTFRVGDRAPTVRQYWDVSFEPQSNLTFDEALEQLHPMLDKAVQTRMISEVPIGAFLSGGVDSGAVVAFMAKHSSTPVTTCSIGFDERSFDESDAARLVSKKYATDHHERQVNIDDFSIASQVAGLYDEPFADSSSIPTFRVCEMARQHVTVALSGDGGDELFGGYRRYGLHLLEERFRSALPLSFRKRVFGPLGEAFPKLDFLPRPFRAKTTLQSLGRDSVAAYFHSVTLTQHADRHRMYGSSFRRSVGDYDALEVFRGHIRNREFPDPLALIQYLDYKTYLPGDINTKVDRASMANSLEVRDPLMDHKLVEWVASLPSTFKNSPRGSKIIFKAALRNELPAQILNRSKMGFAVPIAKWFRGSGGDKLINELAHGPAVESGIIDRDVFCGYAKEHQENRRQRSATLWSVYCLNQFLQNS